MVNMKEVAVGLLFFGSLAALGLLTVWLTDFSLFEESFEYEVYFDLANELRVKDDVLIMGKLQGKVLQVDYHEEPLWSERDKTELWVSVKIKMEVPLTLKEDYRIRIRNANMLGGKVMDIRLGKSQITVNPNNTMLVGLAVRDPIEAISDFVESNKGHVNHTLENVDNIVSDFAEWADRISKGEGLFGRAIYSDSMANNVESFIANAEQFMAELRSNEGVLGLILNDPDTRKRVSDVVENLSSISRKIAAGEGSLGKLIQQDALHEQILSITERLDRMAAGLESGQGLAGKILAEESEKTFDDFARIVDNSRDISEQIRNGEGLVNTLIYNQQIASDLRNVSTKLATIADDIDLIVKDVKAGKGPLGYILRDEELVTKLGKLVDSILGSIEDARESAPLVSLGSFLFGAI